MRANNNFNLTGRLAKDPEAVAASSGTPMCRIRLAVDGYDRATKSKKSDFFTITLFGKTAESVLTYCAKGSYISVVGELRDNQFVDKTGTKRYETQLIASDTSFGPKGSSAGPTTSTEDDDPFGFSN